MDKSLMMGVLTAVSQIIEDDDIEDAVMDSINDDENMELALLAMAAEQTIKKDKTNGFLEDVLPRYTPDDFYLHFRMHRRSVEAIVEALEKADPRQHSGPGLRPLSTFHQVLVGLWTMATTESFREISDRFDVSISTCHDVFNDMCGRLLKCLPNYIDWPSKEEMYSIAARIKSKTRFPGAVGALDGCHIPIKKPPLDDPESYMNGSEKYSIILMAVADHRMIFRDIFVGWPGSDSYSRVYRNSPLAEFIAKGGVPSDLHLLADANFILSSSILTPFKIDGHAIEEMKTFNERLESARATIDDAFGLLKGRFHRIRNSLDVNNIGRASRIVSAACILHNICLMQNDWSEEQMYRRDVGEVESSASEIISESAAIKRNTVMASLQ